MASRMRAAGPALVSCAAALLVASVLVIQSSYQRSELLSSDLYLSAMGELPDPAQPKTYLSAIGSLPFARQEMHAEPKAAAKPTKSSAESFANSNSLDGIISMHAHMDHIRMHHKGDKNIEKEYPPLTAIVADGEHSSANAITAANADATESAAKAGPRTAMLHDVGMLKGLHEDTEQAAHWGSMSTRLPQDRPSLVGVVDHSKGWIPGGWENENKASALRTRSFWSALHDCRAKNSCEQLLGKNLWSVMQTRPGHMNMEIYHDDDDDRKAKERTIEKDYVNARAVDDRKTTSHDVSRDLWRHLKIMNKQDRTMHENELQTKKIRAYEGSMAARAHVQAHKLAKGFADETDAIFGTPKYQASMVPAKADDTEEVTDALKYASTRHTERQRMEKVQQTAQKESRKKAQQAALKELRKLTLAAHVIRVKGHGAAQKALQQSLQEHEEENEREREKVHAEAERELKGFDVPFRSSGDHATARAHAAQQKAAKMSKLAPIQALAVRVQPAPAKAATPEQHTNTANSAQHADVKSRAVRKQARVLPKDTLALEAECWKTGKGCGTLMSGLSADSAVHKAKKVVAPSSKGEAGAVGEEKQRGTENSEGEHGIGLGNLSERLGSVLGW